MRSTPGQLLGSIWTGTIQRHHDMPMELNDKMDGKAIIDPDGFVFLSLGGNISAEIDPAPLNSWVEKTKSVFSEQKEVAGGNLLCLVDITSLRDFDQRSIEIIKGLVASTEAKGFKTAVFGGTTFTQMALRLLIKFDRDHNLHNFDTKEAATAWLREQVISQ